MAKVRRCKLSWKPPGSNLIMGYRLYWSSEESVNYDSNFIELGNVTEVYLPDVLELDPRYGYCVMLGITARESHGNESDMVIISAPRQINAPPAPRDLVLTTLNEFFVVEADKRGPKQFEKLIADYTPEEEEELRELARMAEPLLRPKAREGKVKHYDNVRYRKLAIDWKSIFLAGPIKAQ